MKELEKNLEATGGVPAEAELAAINRFAKSLVAAAHGEETPIDGYTGAYIDQIAYSAYYAAIGTVI